MPPDNLTQTKLAYQAARTSCRLILDNYQQAYKQYIRLGQLFGYNSPKIAEAEKRYLKMRQALMIALAEKDRTKNEYAAALSSSSETPARDVR